MSPEFGAWHRKRGSGRAGSAAGGACGTWPGSAPRSQHPVPSAAAASMGTWRAPAATPELLPGTVAGRCLQAAGSRRALRCNRDRLVWHRQMQQFRAATDTGFGPGFFLLLSSAFEQQSSDLRGTL